MRRAEKEERHTTAAALEATDDILAIAKGDKQRFEALFVRFGPKVKAYLIRHGASSGAAEELAQEAMLNVWRKAHLFNPAAGTGAAWIFTIARNLHIDAIRRERHPDALTLTWPAPAQAPPTPEELLLREERARRLERAVEGLSPAQVEIVRRAFLGAGPLAKVAAELSLPLSTAKSHLRRAVARLKSAMADQA